MFGESSINLRTGRLHWSSTPLRQQREEPISAKEVIRRLERGNIRFCTGKARHPRQDAAAVAKVGREHRPIAVVLTCCDDPVYPHTIFDQSIHDLIHVPMAGHALSKEVLGPIEDAVKYLNVKLVVMLGHERCEAVAAALLRGNHEGSHLDTVIDGFQAAVGLAKMWPGNVEENAAKIHIRLIVSQLRNCKPILAKRWKPSGNGLGIVGAYYSLQTGVVKFNPHLA